MRIKQIVLTSLVVLLLPVVSSLAGTNEPLSPFESSIALTPQSQLDELVFARQKQLQLQPARLCSDAVFLRRAYLDVIGTLPTARAAAQFLANRDPRKRQDLIDRLLARPEFADYWAMKWSDLLRIKAEFPINLWPNAAQAYHRWVRTCLLQNLPYDQFVRQMLTASGSNFEVPQVNFYRAMQNRQPQGIAQTVALTFMGARAEKWPPERLTQMAAFFTQVGYKSTAEWKEEIVLFDPTKTNSSAAAARPDDTTSQAQIKPNQAKSSPGSFIFPDGTTSQLSPDLDPRQAFADWLITPQNPWFTRNIANRVWSWFLGRGIIQEPDDIRPDNPPSNPELLAYLEKELVSSHYNLKHLYRLILTSKTYQLSSIPAPDFPAEDTSFSHYPLRRLEAEVLVDALNQITGTSEKYSSAIPEPFTFVPEDVRSIALPDGSISSSFLELLGRPPRDTGLEAERNNRPSAAQELHLLNSSHIQTKLEQGRNLQNLIQSQVTPREKVNALYLMILSRYPTDQEFKTLGAYAQSGEGKGREVLLDLAWALINSAEFLYRH